eukprot:Nitzschia sp. Nitz4//scaffold219_size35776//20370//21812//NITZ4_007824-RA/size35776-processed-gene-0.11-mRNA-1//-1//CDS//3329542320//5187//frame0
MKIAFVQAATACVWCTFTIVEFAIQVPVAMSRGALNLFHRGVGPPEERETVVIVGGNFAGLSALWELMPHKDLLDIVLIDQRDYFEYTPGILRLVCKPDHANNIAKKLPDQPGVYRRIQGKVTSITPNQTDCPSHGSAASEKVITYRTTNIEAPDQAGIQCQLPYDYLILATGATFASPVSDKSEAPTLSHRLQQWRDAHERLVAANQVLILGGGAVGVELAAEIVDFFPKGSKQYKQVTLIEYNSGLCANLPPRAGALAKEWLVERGVEVRLNQPIKSWYDKGCTMQDGTELKADIVFECLGSKPNSLSLGSNTTGSPFLFNRRGQVVVDNYLRAQASVGGSPALDGTIFCTGDVADSPSANENQGLQAELQGIMAARNVAKLAAGGAEASLVRYPHDIALNDDIPLLFCLSLGRYYGVLGFGNLILPGSFTSIIKWILEYTKVIHMQGRLFGKLIWKMSDKLTLFLSRTFFKVPKKTE